MAAEPGDGDHRGMRPADVTANTIVCGVDRSDAAIPVVRFAETLRRSLGLELVLAHAVAVDSSLHAGLTLLERVASAERVVPAALRCELGAAAHALLRVAAEEDAQLIVVGTRGRGAFRSALLGSVSWAVATGAGCPVAVVPAHAVETGLGRTLVCGLDESPGAHGALRVAAVLASWLGMRLVLVHVAPTPHVPGVSTVPGAAAELRRLGIDEAGRLIDRLAADERLRVPYERRIVFGTVGGALADVAEEEGAGLVVVGSRGRGALRAAVLGSVSSEVIGSSSAPVLIVPSRLSASRG